jgi:hypothetical protein
MRRSAIRSRLNRLEGRRKALASSCAPVPVPYDLAQRIRAAQAAGSHPALLSTADLEAIVALGDRMERDGR